MRPARMGYVVDGFVDGSVGRFVIDTGADGSQIPQALASKLTLHTFLLFQCDYAPRS